MTDLERDHSGACKFSGDKHGLVLCDEKQHESMFCIICSAPLPDYMIKCYACQEATTLVPHLDETLLALERTLVLEKRNK